MRIVTISAWAKETTRVNLRTRDKTEDAHQDSSSPDVDIPRENTFIKQYQPANLALFKIKHTRKIISEGERASYNNGRSSEYDEALFFE